MSRIYHNKSRSGCSRCKQRRVKCSNHGIRCRNCQLRGDDCDLVWHFVSDPPRSPPTRSDLGLVTYFADVASLSVSICHDKRWFWTTELPRQAERIPFLLHGLSAVAALHLAERLPDNDSTLSLSRKHYVSATSQFRLMISQINSENCVPIFALSVIVMVVQLKLSCRHPRHSRLLDDNFNPIDCLGALRGAKNLIQAVGPVLNKSSFSSLFSWHQYEVDPLVERTLQILLARLGSLACSIEHLDCRGELDNLQSWIISLRTWAKSWNQIAWWPSVVSSEYLSKLQKCDSIALTLYACWCCAIHARYKEWFVDGYTVQATRFVKAQIDPSWGVVLSDLVAELELLNST